MVCLTVFFVLSAAGFYFLDRVFSGMCGNKIIYT